MGEGAHGVLERVGVACSRGLRSLWRGSCVVLVVSFWGFSRCRRRLASDFLFYHRLAGSFLRGGFPGGLWA